MLILSAHVIAREIFIVILGALATKESSYSYFENTGAAERFVLFQDSFAVIFKG